MSIAPYRLDLITRMMRFKIAFRTNSNILLLHYSLGHNHSNLFILSIAKILLRTFSQYR